MPPLLCWRCHIRSHCRMALLLCQFDAVLRAAYFCLISWNQRIGPSARQQRQKWVVGLPRATARAHAGAAVAECCMWLHPPVCSISRPQGQRAKPTAAAVARVAESGQARPRCASCPQVAQAPRLLLPLLLRSILLWRRHVPSVARWAARPCTDQRARRVAVRVHHVAVCMKPGHLSRNTSRFLHLHPMKSLPVCACA